MQATPARPLGAHLFVPDGTIRELDWNAVRAWTPRQGWLWIHLDRTDPAACAWVRNEAGLDAIASEALLEEETRPRLAVGADGRLLVILRGVNLNPDAQPDDMISLRGLFTAERAITLRSRRLVAIQEIRDELAAGRGPRTPGDLLVSIASGLVGLQAPVVDAMEEVVDGVEQELVDAQNHTMRARISEFRRKAIGLRRYLAPQRDVLVRLSTERLPWLDDLQRARLREIAERQTRLVEELDSARDRAAVAQEELAARLAEQLNRNMYVLSIVAAVFLPLGLLTGLLGINVGGIPGEGDPRAFVFVCVLLVALAGLVLWMFRRWRML